MSTAHATAPTPGLHVVPEPTPRRGGRPPGNAGQKYPANPWTVTDLFRLLRACDRDGKHHGRINHVCGVRLRAAIVVMWRAGLRVQECLDLDETDLDRTGRRIVVRRGKGGRRRVIAMDDFGWAELDRWLALRRDYPAGPVFCGIHARSAGRPWTQDALRRAMAQAGRRAGLTRRCNPHSLRHTTAVDLWREGTDTFTIQRQLGHAHLNVTAVYLAGLGADDLLEPVAQRRPPVLPLALQLAGT